jgi:hypothetical protein
MKKLVAILTLVCLSAVANASNLSFNVNAGANIGTAAVVTDIAGLATSGSLVLTSGLVGTYSLHAYAGAPVQKISPLGAFIYNNMTYSGAAADLDIYGLLFVGNGLEINIWGNGVGNPYSFYAYNGSSFIVSSNAASFAAVPVPAAVWLFGSAFIGLAGMVKRKQK